MFKRTAIRFAFWLMLAITAFAALVFVQYLALDIVQIGDPPRPDLVLRAQRLYPLLMGLFCAGLVLAIGIASFGANHERAIGIVIAIIMGSGVLTLALQVLTEQHLAVAVAAINPVRNY